MCVHILLVWGDRETQWKTFTGTSVVLLHPQEGVRGAQEETSE